MHRRSPGNRKLPTLVLAACLLGTMASSANAAPVELTLTNAEPGTWPVLAEDGANLSPVLIASSALNDASGGNGAISAPLPPAVITGAFVLGGQWVATMLWKKRKI